MSVIISTKELYGILEAIPARQNIMLVGRHGIGKSEILTDYFGKKGIPVIALFLGQMSDPGDLIGLPQKNEKLGQTEFLLPYWFPKNNEPVVLFLDELNRARPEILQTIMDLALNRKLAGKELPEGSRIISAVNFGDEYQITDLDPALVSRFNIYEFQPTVNEWLLWASQNDIDLRVINFIEHEPVYLDGEENQNHDYDGLQKSPDRRGWEKVSSVIRGIERLNDVHKKIIAGIVGVKACSHFMESIKKADSVQIEDLMTGDFEKNLLVLSGYNCPQLARVNESIFRYLQTGKYEEKTKGKIAENLETYFDFLSNNRESQAHFVSIFSGTDYPDAVVFILENCDSLYTKLSDFIRSIN